MNCENFVDEFIAEFTEHPECYDNYVDLLDTTLDDIVINNSIEENKIIINNYSGDVFTAINLYRKYLGNVDELYKDMIIFYQQLAFISLFVKIYPIIEKKLSMNISLVVHKIHNEYNERPEIYENDIITLIDDIIDETVINNDLKTNKMIVDEYSDDLNSIIELYRNHLGYLDILNTKIKIIYEKLAYIILFINIYHKIHKS